MFRYLILLRGQEKLYNDNRQRQPEDENYGHVISQVYTTIKFVLYYFGIMTLFRSIIMFKSYHDMSHTSKVGLLWLAILIDRLGDVFRFAVGYATEALCTGDVYKARKSKDPETIHTTVAIHLCNTFVLCVLSSILFLIASIIFDKIKGTHNLTVHIVLLLIIMLGAKTILILNGILRLINDSFGKHPYSVLSTIVQLGCPQIYYMLKLYYFHTHITIYDIIISSVMASICAIVINYAIYYCIFRRSAYVIVDTKELTTYLYNSAAILPGYLAKYTSRLALTELIMITTNLHRLISVTDVALMYGVYRNLSGYYESPSTTGNRASVRFAHNNITLLKGFLLSNYLLWAVYLVFVLLISRMSIHSLFYVQRSVSKIEVITIIGSTLLISIYRSIESFNSTLLRNRWYNAALITAELIYLAYYISNIYKGIIDISSAMLLRHSVYLIFTLIVSYSLDTDNSFRKCIPLLKQIIVAHTELFFATAIYLYYY